MCKCLGNGCDAIEPSCCKVLKMDLVAHCNALLIRFEAAHQYNNMTDKNFKDVPNLQLLVFHTSTPIADTKPQYEITN
jgi:hypothetical protein